MLERLTQVTLPQDLQPQIGTDWSPVGQIYFYTLKSTNPQYDVMDLKSLEDWVLEKQFKSVPNVVDVSSLGGVTREYQVRVDPDKLISYGLSIGQVEQQLANNNVNAGGSFIEEGLQQVNVRAVGWSSTVRDIEDTVIKAQNGTALRVRDIATVVQGPKIRLGRNGKAIHREDGKIIDNDDVVEGIVLLRKGADSDAALDGIHDKVKELNERILPPGVKVVPFLDRSDLVHYTTHTVLHNLTEGIILVAIILFVFLGNVRGALIVALTIPFSLLFASICLDLRHIPANLLSLGALDFGMVVDGAVVMVENIVRHMGRQDVVQAGHGPHSRGGARSAAAGVLRHRDHHHGVPADFHAAERGRPAVQAHGLDGGFCVAGRADLLHGDGAGAFELPLPGGHARVAQPADGVYDGTLQGSRLRWAVRKRWVMVGGAVVCAGGGGLPVDQRLDRLRIPAAPGRRRHLGARHAGAEHRTDRRHPPGEPGAGDAGLFPGGHAWRPARWDGRTTERTPRASSIRNTSSISNRRNSGGRSSTRTKRN